VIDGSGTSDVMEVPALELLSVEKTYPNGTRALEPVSLSVRQGRVRLLARPLGLRQEHAAEDDRRPARAEQRAAAAVGQAGRSDRQNRPPVVVRVPGGHADAVGAGARERAGRSTWPVCRREANQIASTWRESGGAGDQRTNMRQLAQAAAAL